MDFWASLEHRIRYKKNVDSVVAQQVAAELRKCAEDSARLDLRMEKVKNTIREAEKPKACQGYAAW